MGLCMANAKVRTDYFKEFGCILKRWTSKGSSTQVVDFYKQISEIIHSVPREVEQLELALLSIKFCHWKMSQSHGF